MIDEQLSPPEERVVPGQIRCGRRYPPRALARGGYGPTVHPIRPDKSGYATERRSGRNRDTALFRCTRLGSVTSRPGIRQHVTGRERVGWVQPDLGDVGLS